MDTDRAALEKINAIRNSIIGTQTVNWSAHVYPLVAALSEAGYQGQGYEEARKEAQTLLDRANSAEAEVRRLRSVLQAVANMENSPMGTAYELQRVLADVRAALATPASPPPARQEE